MPGIRDGGGQAPGEWEDTWAAEVERQGEYVMDSETDQRFKFINKLLLGKWRKQFGKFIGTGQMFLRMRPLAVYVKQSVWETPKKRQTILSRIQEGGEEGHYGAAPGDTKIVVLSNRLFTELYSEDVSQGMISVFEAPPNAQPSELTEVSRLVVLDRVCDPNNAGMILRSMEAFKATALVTVKGTVDPYNEKVLRCSMGALPRGYVKLLQVDGPEELKELLTGFRVFATTTARHPEKGIEASQIPQHLTGKDAFVFSHESAGVTPEVLDMADRRVKIPVAAPVDSLNVAMTAAIVLHSAAIGARDMDTE
jgi:TrmH family RNA methyltransferase